MGYPKLSYATYRLKILTPPGQVYLLHIPEIMSSSLIWINGEEFYGAGTVGGSDADTVTGVRNELLAAASPNGTLELVIQAANYRMNGSGIFYPILMGRDTVLIHHVFWQRTVVAAALGGILLIGVYHLFLYFFRRRERLYLTFSLICLTTGAASGNGEQCLSSIFFRVGLALCSAGCFYCCLPCTACASVFLWCRHSP